MKIIISAKITDGYPKWRDAFVSADALREKHGLKVLAWGHPKGCLLYTSPSPRD